MVLNFLKTSYKKVKGALTKTGSLLGNKLRSLFSQKIDEETLEQLEQLFYEADLGLQTATELTQKVRDLYAKNPQLDGEALLAEIRKDMVFLLSQHSTALVTVTPEQSPLVILIVGVNGNGKTTSVAKLARLLQAEKKKVLVAGADTFRAAAMEQLETWAQRLGVDIVKGNPKSDPASVVFDAITAGKARNADVVLVDTAGRLHTKTHLMQELEKIRRTCQKVHPSSPHETLLVLDATTGQNAIDQARIFNQFTPITGLILTKLDGTAKGGIVISIYRQLGIPIKFIGVGEGFDDLEPFHPESFVSALFD
ncbi:MAG: signal recognition particle-docking protein FtsY [Parachlamydiaceae bacterium]|nr:signal recognition particle-docking protein FtsY [Parachlamydiaceae bacterium]